MAYSELIKSFVKIRSYISDFYIYGFRHRDEFTDKSMRSYDNERRRIESWLGDYMGFRQTSDGKNVFLSIDSRACPHDPLYRAFKSKSFTDGDITLHFILFDILHDPNDKFTLNEICERINSHYLAGFEKPMTFDDSTVRKKLKEYVRLGLIDIRKDGRTVRYSRTAEFDLSCWRDALEFFSEEAPLGVVGSFITDKLDMPSECFKFKHHYITQTLDSEIMLELFEAICEKRWVLAEINNRHTRSVVVSEIVPLKILISTQSGRNYVLAYSGSNKTVCTVRIDFIVKIKQGELCLRYDEIRQRAEEISEHSWGVVMNNHKRGMEHIEFTVRFSPDEPYIYERLQREKRCGRVTRLDECSARFEADVYDLSEMIPWLRTFICRITSLSMSNKNLESRFKHDIRLMYQMYGIVQTNREVSDNDIQ